MRTHKQLLIATRHFASESPLRSWWHVGSTLAVTIGLTQITTSDLHWGGRIGPGLMLGLVLVRIFVLFHDHQHGAILRGSSLANVLMRVIGLVLLCPSSAWQRSHNHHHAHNSKLSAPGVGSYPLATVEEYRRMSRMKRLSYAIQRHPITMLCGYITVFLYGMCIRPLIANPQRHRDGAVSITVHAILLIWFAWGDDLAGR